MTKSTSIPAPVINLLNGKTWNTEDYCLHRFTHGLEHHAHHDAQDGYTAQYVVADDGNDFVPPIRELLQSGVVHTDLYMMNDGYSSINQHYLHSLEQMLAQCQKAWDDHQSRTTKLLGTAAGRIDKSNYQ